MRADLGDEDSKLVVLARAALARVAASSAAAVRDETGRTYVAVPVSAGPLRISALALAVAMALASGASALEAAALVGAEPAPDDLAALAAAGSGALVLLADSDGSLRATITA